MSAIILYRELDTSTEELEAITEFFPATFMRTGVPHRIDNEPQWLVIGRYSVLPYYQELIRELVFRGARLINSYEQHQFVADIGQWSEVLGELTPKTWKQGSFDELPSDKSFVLKGQTNSKKFLWRTHMFAEGRYAVREVFGRLLDDTLIGTQTIYAREYIPLVNFGKDINGLPITKEIRIFVLFGEVVGSGYYWSNHVDEVRKLYNDELPSIDEVPEKFLQKVINKIGDLVSFYTVDIAQTDKGEWIVIDLNDGQMSGLSEVRPRDLYRSMHELLRKRDLI